jgi:hypothetical protein
VKGFPITPHVGRSPDAAIDFDDESFDIVYIDAEHDYDSVLKDIKAWKPKAKYVIAGHDFHVFPGVKKAVDESFVTYQTEANVWSKEL